MSDSNLQSDSPLDSANGRNGNHAGPSDDILWQRFGAATTSRSFSKSWLGLPCPNIHGVTGGAVLLGGNEENRPFEAVAVWPDDQQDLKHLTEVAERSVRERRGVV